MSVGVGRHHLQIPGPSNVPERVLRAMAAPTIDHRGSEFGIIGCRILEKLKPIFGASEHVVLFPASGTGAWEAALVNALSQGDRVLCFETGHFALLWKQMAAKLGLEVELVEGDWRHGVDPDVVATRLSDDATHRIKAVLVVHNETSTGITSRLSEVRAAIDSVAHPALLLVDAMSSLVTTEYRHDEWGIDVTIAGSQKGLMLPPGLSFNAVSKRALAACEESNLPKSYWDWRPIIQANEGGHWPYTPPTNLIFGLAEALDMIEEEGLDAVIQRHARHGEAARVAVRAWGLEVMCLDQREYSASVTAMLLAESWDADEVRNTILERYNLSLGSGLGKLKRRVIRIGHLGYFNDVDLMGTLSGVQMGLGAAGLRVDPRGIVAAAESLQRS